MQYTENYSMNKPQFGENALVTKLNENADTLDTLIYNTRQMQADTYDSTQTYNTGDLVSYNSALYRCLADNVTGTWDATKWVATNLAEEVMNAGGGESALADLDDVNLTNPANGQLLQYNGSEWVNGDATVTKTASGNPIEFTDGADAPLVKCTTAIQGNQDLHGYDKPWVGGAGKNKLPLTVDGIKSVNTWSTWSGNSYTLNGMTFKIVTDDDGNVLGVHVSGTNTGSATIIFYLHETSEFVLPAGTYIYSSGVTSVSGNIRMRFSDGNFFAVTTSEVTRTMAESHDVMSSIVIEPNDTTTGILFAPMIRKSTDASGFAPYSNICPITAYNQSTISLRGKNLLEGKIDNSNIVNNGTIVTSAETDFDIHYAKVKQGSTYTITDGSASSVFAFFSTVPTTGTQSYNQSRTVVENHTFTAPIDGYVGVRTAHNYATPQLEEGSTATPYEPYTKTTHTATFSQSIYQGNADFVKGEVMATHVYVDLSTLSWSVTQLTPDISAFVTGDLQGMAKYPLNNSTPFSGVAEKYATVSINSIYNANCAIAMNNGGNMYVRVNGEVNNPSGGLVYELATPTTEQISVSNLPIKSLFGYNHIESSTGDMEIEYITENYQPLVDLIQSSNGHTYSTQEQVVGKWIDGRDLYECTFELSNPSGSGVISTGQTYDIAFLVSGYYVLNDGNSILSANQFLATSNFTYVHVEKDGDIQYRVNGYTATKLSVTIRYTKPTQTRSLSAPVTSQKAQIEPLTDKEEEVPTEENEEENTNDER